MRNHSHRSVRVRGTGHARKTVLLPASPIEENGLEVPVASDLPRGALASAPSALHAGRSRRRSPGTLLGDSSALPGPLGREAVAQIPTTDDRWLSKAETKDQKH